MFVMGNFLEWTFFFKIKKKKQRKRGEKSCKTLDMQNFSIKTLKRCITWASNCKFFYNVATVMSYLYDVIIVDGTILNWFFLSLHLFSPHMSCLSVSHSPHNSLVLSLSQNLPPELGWTILNGDWHNLVTVAVEVEIGVVAWWDRQEGMARSGRRCMP